MSRVRLAAITILILGLAACGDARAPELAARAGTGPPRTGGTAVIAGSADLGAMNALVASDAATQEFVRSVLFLPLLRHGPNLELEPALARSWRMLGDTGVVFELRDDVVWHDGARTTAYDVAFTYRLARDPATAFPYAEYFERWHSVEVLDSFRIRFGFRPHADPLGAWALIPPMPRHLLDTVPPARIRDAAFNRRPIGNGLFRFVEHRPAERWIFEANASFPADLGGRPLLDRLVWRIVPENAAQVIELRTGRADLILSARADQMPDLVARPNLRAIVRPSRRYVFIGWNGRHPHLHDSRVRRALTMALDRQRIIDAIRGGFGEVAFGPIDPQHWAYHDGLHPLPHDPAAAAALLRDAGFADRDADGVLDDASGRPLQITLNHAAGIAFQRDLAELIRADLAAAGVRVTTEPLEFGTLVAELSTPDRRRFDAVIMGWEGDLRLDLAGLFHSAAMDGPFQFAAYDNPEVDRILDRTAELTDRDAARPLWHRLQEILREDQPWTFLYYFPDLYVARERLRGIDVDVRGLLSNVQRWWVDDAHLAMPGPGPDRLSRSAPDPPRPGD